MRYRCAAQLGGFLVISSHGHLDNLHKRSVLGIAVNAGGQARDGIGIRQVFRVDHTDPDNLVRGGALLYPLQQDRTFDRRMGQVEQQDIHHLMIEHLQRSFGIRCTDGAMALPFHELCELVLPGQAVIDDQDSGPGQGSGGGAGTAATTTDIPAQGYFLAMQYSLHFRLPERHRQDIGKTTSEIAFTILSDRCPFNQDRSAVTGIDVEHFPWHPRWLATEQGAVDQDFGEAIDIIRQAGQIRGDIHGCTAADQLLTQAVAHQ